MLGAVGVTFDQPTDCCWINVKDYGAIGDGNADDSTAIQSTIDAAKAFNKTTVCLPPGRYRLTHAIRPEVDNFTLLGSAGTILIANPADGEKFPEAILVNKGVSSIAEEVHRVTLQDMTIEVNNGFDSTISAGVIQLNNCKDCLVRNVYEKYTGPSPKPKNIDGIVTANGTSGLIQGCIVDGMPKAGIYIAQGSYNVQVEGCEVRNTNGTVGQTGILVTSSDRILINNCFSHHNARAGLMIAVNFLTFRVGLEFQRDLEQGSLSQEFRQAFNAHVISLSGNVTITTDPVESNKWLSNDIDRGQNYTVISNDETLTIYIPPVPATNIQVVGGMYHDNGQFGVWITSASNQVIPMNIQLAGVTALNNAMRGIQIEAGWDVLIASPTVIDSGNAGIWLENKPSVAYNHSQFDSTHPRTTRVQISNPHIYNNGRTVNVDVPGIGIMAVDQVTITGGKIYKTPAMAGRRQHYGIGLNKNSIGETCTNLRILDVDAAVGHKKPVAPLDASTMLEDPSAAASGYYRLQSTGSPEGALSAPIGSENVDLATGYAYRKATGSGPLGWIQTFPLP